MCGVTCKPRPDAHAFRVLAFAHSRCGDRESAVAAARASLAALADDDATRPEIEAELAGYEAAKVGPKD